MNEISNKGLIFTKSHLPVVFFVATLLFFSFDYTFSFDYDIFTNAYFLFIPYLLITLAVVANSIKKEVLPIGEVLRLLIVIIFYFLLSFSKIFSFVNEHFFILVFSFTFYCLLRSTSNEIKTTPFPLILTAIFLAQLIVSTIQYWNNLDNPEKSLSIKGTFQNSGILACFMVVSFPTLLFVLHTYFKKAVLKIILGVFFCVAVIIILIVTKSRTGILAFLILIPILSYNYRYISFQALRKMSKFKKAILCGILIVCILFLLVGLIDIKKLSAFGRLLTLKIGVSHLDDNLLFGTGPGRFTWYYPQWQIEYFASTPAPPLEFYLSAGETSLLFNEFFQLVLEVGLIGAGIIIFIFYDFFKLKNTTNDNFVKTLRVTVLGILLCGFTSYPLHVNLFIFIIFYSLATIHKQFKAPKFFIPASRLKIPLYLLFILVIGFSYKIFTGAYAMYKWNVIKNNYSMSWENKIDKYEEIHRSLHNENGKFLLNYAETLLENHSELEKAIYLLEESKQYFISYKTFQLCAAAYKLKNDTVNSIKNYEYLSFYVPSRFRPKYELVKLYYSQGNITKANELALRIVEMPVKVNSEEVEKIKREMKLFLQHSPSFKPKTFSIQSQVDTEA
jgi:hypothetical protein